MTVVFATSVPFIRQHEIDMYIDAIEEHYQVEKWDLSRIYGREQDEVTNLATNVKKYDDIEQIEIRLKELSQNGKVVLVTNILISRLKKIYKLLKKHGVTIVNINKEGLAAWLSYSAEKGEVHHMTIKRMLHSMIVNNSVLRRMYKRFCFGNVKYDYLLSSYNFFPEETCNFVKIHNVKFDEYLDAVQKKSLIDGEYILFVDAALMDHPMFNSATNKPNREKYLEQLNILFDKYEELYGVPVIISAHPKSNYDSRDFKNRRIIKYETPILIQHCKYILSHYSTSLVNALLLDKPIQIIYSDELINSATRPSMLMGMEFAKLLNLQLIDLENTNVVKFNEDISSYKSILYKYIINENKKNLSNKELILSFLQKLMLERRNQV